MTQKYTWYMALSYGGAYLSGNLLDLVARAPFSQEPFRGRVDTSIPIVPVDVQKLFDQERPVADRQPIKSKLPKAQNQGTLRGSIRFLILRPALNQGCGVGAERVQIMNQITPG